MSKIKVIVRSVELANELIEYWKNKDVDLEISVEENTTGANSDVKKSPFRDQVVSHGKLIELD